MALVKTHKIQKEEHCKPFVSHEILIFLRIEALNSPAKRITGLLTVF